MKRVVAQFMPYQMISYRSIHHTNAGVMATIPAFEFNTSNSLRANQEVNKLATNCMLVELNAQNS